MIFTCRHPHIQHFIFTVFQFSLTGKSTKTIIVPCENSPITTHITIRMCHVAAAVFHKPFIFVNKVTSNFGAEAERFYIFCDLRLKEERVDKFFVYFGREVRACLGILI